MNKEEIKAHFREALEVANDVAPTSDLENMLNSDLKDLRRIERMTFLSEAMRLLRQTDRTVLDEETERKLTMLAGISPFTKEQLLSAAFEVALAAFFEVGSGNMRPMRNFFEGRVGLITIAARVAELRNEGKL